MNTVLINGGIVAALRAERGMTQEGLAEVAGISTRTVQRAERGGGFRSSVVRSIADALGVGPLVLQGTASVETLRDLATDFTCRWCGARLVECVPVPFEHGEDELRSFACGAQTGWRERPCPKAPNFPKFEDFELVYFEDGGQFWCKARGNTEFARSLDLAAGWGDTNEDAARMVERSYCEARDGSTSCGDRP